MNVARASAHAEPLERRQLLSSTELPVPDHRDVVYDPHRSPLYVIGEEDRTRYRYDAATRQLLEPWPLGFISGAADITPDASALYVSGRNTDLTDLFGGNAMYRVDLETGAIQET